MYNKLLYKEIHRKGFPIQGFFRKIAPNF